MTMIDGLAYKAVEASWGLAQSALPSAPVVADVPRGPRRGLEIRARAARALRRVADVLNPQPLPASSC